MARYTSIFTILTLNVGKIPDYYHDSLLNIDIISAYIDWVSYSLMYKLYISYKMLISKRKVLCVDFHAG